MNAHERYLFDTLGYLVVPDVLNADEVAELHGYLDDYDLWARAERGELEDLWSNDSKFISGGRPHTWDEPFRRLIEHPRILEYMRELIGPQVRYDHGHMILMREGSTRLGLHGGGTPFLPDSYYLYRNERIYNGLVAAAISLVDAREEDGGFVAIPGSHKANIACPEDFTTLETVGPWLHHVPVTAGDAVVFTEALTHGTWPWTADYERRAVFLKYSAPHSAWADEYPSVEDAPDAEASDVMRGLLQRPFIAGPNGERKDALV
jgi:ectoine hydroxylase-related dioxygenase (phytanoyl-CoA dioxygenase family)